MTILNTFFFIIFILGIFEVYILSNIEEYYNRLQSDVIKKIIDPSYTKKEEESKKNVEVVLQYFNLVSSFFILIGLLTNYWYIFLSLFILMNIGNYLQSKYELTSLVVNKGGVNKSLKRLKSITYVTMIIKVIGLFGVGILYFHEFI